MNIKSALFTFLCLFSSVVFGQVGIGTTNPASSSILDISSEDKGMLIPRMTQLQRNAIPSPANGLMVYQIDDISGFYYYNGSAWTSMSASSGDNLGDHTATQAFNMSNNSITNASSIGLIGTSSTVFDFNRFDAGDIANDQFRLNANGVLVFGVLGDGRVNTRGDILMVNNATVDKIDLSSMVGLTGSHLGTFSGNILADNLSIKNALQILENAVEVSLSSKAKTTGSETLETKDITPKFSVSTNGNLDVVNKTIHFDQLDFDASDAYLMAENCYKIPLTGTYFIQFQYTEENIANEEIINESYISILNNGKETIKIPLLMIDNKLIATASLFRIFNKGDIVQASIKKSVASPINCSVSFSGFMVK